jgi:putative DNA primase/helicase
VIPDAQKDKDLPAKLAQAAPGILAWIVQGAVDWYAGGLRTPEAVVAATDEYRKEMDVIGSFIDDACAVDDRGEVTAADLYTAYRLWCSEEGFDALTRNLLGRELTRRGFRDRKRGGTQYRVGLRLPGVRTRGQ